MTRDNFRIKKLKTRVRLELLNLENKKDFHVASFPSNID